MTRNTSKSLPHYPWFDKVIETRLRFLQRLDWDFTEFLQRLHWDSIETPTILLYQKSSIIQPTANTKNNSLSVPIDIARKQQLPPTNIPCTLLQHCIYQEFHHRYLRSSYLSIPLFNYFPFFMSISFFLRSTPPNNLLVRTCFWGIIHISLLEIFFILHTHSISP